jgi:arylsulfatase
VTRHQSGTPFDDDRWELYHVAEDASECHDLAERHPDRLAELVALWWSEAAEHNVLPLDDRTVELFGTRFREHSPHPADRRYTYRPPMAPMPAQVGAPLGGRSWEMAAEIDRAPGGGGVLYATGTENSGLSFFVQDDHLVFDYNFFGEHTVLVSERPVPEGRCVVGLRFDRDQGQADATLVIAGEVAGSVHLDQLMNIMSSVGPSVGFDHGSAVSDRYQAPFPFTGLRALHIDADPSGRHLGDDDLAFADYVAEMSRQ